MFDKFLKTMGAVAILGAIAVGASAIAGAASDSGTTGATGATSNQSDQAPSGRPPVDPATMKQGPGETLLTDGTASKVKQAALDKVPGATVIRVETDSDGSPYEAHLQKSDGSEVTVKVDKSFNATDVQTGFGPGPGHGPGGPDGGH
jgi:uncharacterized membrane protein YkoI